MITTLLVHLINVAKPLADHVYRVSRLLRTCVKRFTSRFSKKIICIRCVFDRVWWHFQIFVILRIVIHGFTIGIPYRDSPRCMYYRDSR